MNRKDFTPCAGCGKGVAHTGLPLFWRLKIERMGINHRAVRTQAGLETMLGSVALADAFSGGPIATPIHEGVTILLCENCAMDSTKPVAVLAMTGEPR